MHSHHFSRAGMRAAAAAVAVALVLAVAACGSSSSSAGGAGGSGASSTSTTHFAKTKFVFHAGLAFGAFHHFIWKPARAGEFSHPFSHKLTILKAGLAAAFVLHESKLALADAQADPTLSKVVAPITALQNRLHGLPAQVRSGNTAALGADNSSIGSVESQSSSTGQPIQEQVPSHI